MKPRYVLFATAVAGGLVGSISARADAPPHSEAGPAWLRSPQIDATTLALLRAKLGGQIPDFRELARHSGEYQRASGFRQTAVADHLTSTFASTFEQLSPAKVYTLNLNATLLQYDPERGGWPTDFTDDKYISFNDPLGGALQLSFDNSDAFNVLPVPPDAAEKFAERHGINERGSFAGSVTLRLAFRVVAAPPALDTTSSPVLAHIVDAEMLQTFGGGVLHVFPPAPDAGNAPSPSPVPADKLPSLPESSLAGVTLGMSQQAASDAGLARFSGAAVTRDGVSTLLVDGLLGNAPPRCGRPPKIASLVPVPDDPPGLYTACLEFDVVDGKVAVIRSNQFLTAGTRIEEVEKTLRQKYGRPVRVEQIESGHVDTWVGAGIAGDPTTVEATLQKLGQVVALRIRIHPWSDPHATRASAPLEAAPKL